MPRFRPTIRSLVLAVAVLGFDSAVLIRAYQHGRWSAMVSTYLIGFGLLLVLFNLILVSLYAALARMPAQGRLSARVSPTIMLGFYLAVLAIPILAILFMRPGTF